jgi:hypothetical protein
MNHPAPGRPPARQTKPKEHKMKTSTAKAILEQALKREISDAELPDVIESESIDGNLTLNIGADGILYVWYFDGVANIAADDETGRELTEEEIQNLLE